MEMTSTFINSLLPQTSNGQQENTVCTPGDKLFSVSDGFHAGSGCYEFHGTIRASLTGYVHVYELKNSQGVKTKIVEVRRNLGERCHLLPSQGKIVTARVEQVTQKFAKCSIICVEGAMLPSEFNSTLRKEDVREKERDKVELYKFIHTGDLILARVLGYGEAQTSYLLTIAEDQLGVTMGKGQNGERLVPYPGDPTMMKAFDSEYKESRKVAQLAQI